MNDDRASLPTSGMPDFLAWRKANDESTFNTTDYLIGVVGAAALHPDFLLALTELLWPRFVEVDGAIFHAAHFDAARHDVLLDTHPAVRDREYWINLVLLDRLFEAADGEFFPRHAAAILAIAASMWRSRLKEVFPERAFEVMVIEDAEAGDYGLTFTQAERSPA